MDALDRLTFPTYTLRRKFLKIFGASFHIFDPDGNVVLFCKQKALRLREDVRLFTDESQTTELLRISTKSVFDISGTYDVIDSIDGDRVGALRRRGLKSMFKDEWLFIDEQGNEIGTIKEDSALLATLRRFIEAASFLFPQKYHAEIQGQPVATFKQRFNPFIQKLDIDFTPDAQGLLDRRLGLAAAVMLGAIEGRQN
ncbi:MAG: hypothetical protein AAGI68_07065 [Planctomycetota bacterium]